MARDNVIAFQQTAELARRRSMDAKVKDLVGRCRGVVATTLPPLLQDLFEGLDDNLYELADKASSDALQTRYFEAMRELRKLRQGIDREFFERVLVCYDGFWNGNQAAIAGATWAGDDNELALVENAELEEDLAVASIITKAANRFRRDLYALNLRFSELAAANAVDDEHNPVGPAQLTRCFRQAMDRWEGDMAVKLVVYKLFDRHVVNFIGGLYDEINDILIEGGVLPKIVPRVRRNPVAPSVQQARDPASSQAAQPAPEPAAPAAQQELLSLLSELLAMRRGSQGACPTHLPVVPANEVLGALSELQHTVLGAAPVNVDEAWQTQGSVRLALFRQLGIAEGEGAAARRRFAEPEQDVIDVISMLFEFILDDRNLPDAMKALLSRLQIPMLKVAILDRGFFASKNHPARRLLNSLARAAVGWVDDGDRSPNSLYGRVEAVVLRVLTEFSDDMALFKALDEQFSADLEREARGAEIAEERIAQVNRGQEQLKLARAKVREQLELRIQANPPLPQPVHDLLWDGWKDVLLLALLREGEDSAAWRVNLQIADRLLWSVRPKGAPEERQRMLKTIPELLRELRNGLANISFDQHRAATLFKELQSCHIAALRSALPPAVNAAPNPVASAPTESQAAESQQPEQAAHELDEAVVPGRPAAPQVTTDSSDELAWGLAVGQWLAWEENGQQLRGKLAWKSAVTGTYVFVNRKGIKVAEMTAPSLAALFRGERAQVLEHPSVPMMDRALQAMVEALRSTDPGEGNATPNPA